MKTAVTILISFLLFFSFGAWAQASKPRANDKTIQAAVPEDISGMYTFLQDGEFVQITVEEQGSISGFISRYGELPSDKGAFLDQFIKKGTLEGKNLVFITDPVHGVWYEFRGTVERGAGKTPGAEAYYVLKGRLTENTTDAQHNASARSREVELKSFPQDVVLDKPKRD